MFMPPMFMGGMNMGAASVAESSEAEVGEDDVEEEEDAERNNHQDPGKTLVLLREEQLALAVLAHHPIDACLQGDPSSTDSLIQNLELYFGSLDIVNFVKASVLPPHRHPCVEKGELHSCVVPLNPGVGHRGVCRSIVYIRGKD